MDRSTIDVNRVVDLIAHSPFLQLAVAVMGTEGYQNTFFPCSAGDVIRQGVELAQADRVINST